MPQLDLTQLQTEISGLVEFILFYYSCLLLYWLIRLFYYIKHYCIMKKMEFQKTRQKTKKQLESEQKKKA